MMGSEEKLPWYLRIMYALPILLCVIITVATVINYNRIGAPPVAVAESKLQEETERGEEILQEQRAQNEES